MALSLPVPLRAATSADGTISFTPLAVVLFFAAGGLLLTAVYFSRRHRRALLDAHRQLNEFAEREEELRRVIDTTPLPSAMIRDNGGIMYLNRKFVETFGYAPAQVPDLESWWPKAYPDPDYREKVAAEWTAQLAAAASGAMLPPLEVRVTCRDGSTRVIEWRGTRVGSHTLIVGTDLTDRLRASEALQLSEKRYRLLLEHAPEAIVVLDIGNGRFIDCNPSAEALFKYPRAELLRLGPLDVSPATQPGGRPSAELAAQYIADARAGKTPVFEWRHRDGFGNEFSCEIRLLRLPDLDGREVVRGSIVDISARKQAEDVLKESEERFRLLIENSTELVAQVDLDGRFVYVSPNHDLITGFTSDELLGRPVFDFIHPDDAISVLQAFRTGQDHESRVFRMQFRDGSWHWLESTGRRFRTSGGVEMAAIISRDITQRVKAEEVRKRLEAQLRQSQKMEAIGTLAGGIAHDFNNILTGLFGNIQLAQSQLTPAHPAHSYLAASYKAAQRARDLVGKILTFSRRHEQKKQVLSLGAIVREAAGLLRASLPATIEIRLQEFASNLTILCDPGQVHQLIMNLGANAAYAMREHGSVLTIVVDDLPPEAGVLVGQPRLGNTRVARLTVRDTGCGMDAATRAQIFEPFFTTKPAGEGTGLGLAIVHGIVEDHGGAIAIESEKGKGTNVRVWFPLAKDEAAAHVPAPPPVHRGRGERVLLVDDEPSVTDVGTRILRTLGYDVVAFTHPADALAEFRRNPGQFSALVTDLTMPELTGPELARHIRAMRAEIPVLVMTGYLRPADVDNARATGLRHFLEKPFTFESLGEALQRALVEK